MPPEETLEQLRDRANDMPSQISGQSYASFSENEKISPGRGVGDLVATTVEVPTAGGRFLAKSAEKRLQFSGCAEGFFRRELLCTSSVILIGDPTPENELLGRLWIALQAGKGALSTSGTPANIRYVEEVVAHLHQGRFAPRTEQNLEADQGSVRIPLGVDQSNGEKIAELIIPDVSGEIWKKAVVTSELSSEWMVQLEGAVGALLFVRVLSDLNVSPLDWVNAAKIMEYQGGNREQDQIPTQVMLCEFLRYLELKLTGRKLQRKPRIAVMVTAWDRLDNDRSAAGPRSYLRQGIPVICWSAR